jgi:hypothetical protein
VGSRLDTGFGTFGLFAFYVALAAPLTHMHAHAKHCSRSSCAASLAPSKIACMSACLVEGRWICDQSASFNGRIQRTVATVFAHGGQALHAGPVAAGQIRLRPRKI